MGLAAVSAVRLQGLVKLLTLARCAQDRDET